VPSSGSFLDPSESLEIPIEEVVHHIMYVNVACVPECCGSPNEWYNSVHSVDCFLIRGSSFSWVSWVDCVKMESTY
jgi:hypothetical protein